MEKQAHLAVLNFDATIGEFGGRTENQSVGWADGVEFFFSALTVLAKEVFKVVDEAIEITV